MKDANNGATGAVVVRAAAVKLMRISANRLKKARNRVEICVCGLLLLYWTTHWGITNMIAY